MKSMLIEFPLSQKTAINYVNLFLSKFIGFQIFEIFLDFFLLISFQKKQT